MRQKPDVTLSQNDEPSVDRGDDTPAQLHRIAIAVDFGASSVAAARWVSSRFAPDVELLLIHALDTAAPPSRSRSMHSPRDASDHALQRLRDLADSMGGMSKIRVEVSEHRPAAALARVAEATGADAIVVGPHGGRESIRGIGTTAERLIRMSPVPVLLVAHPRPRPPSQLLVAVDAVNLTTEVMEWADLLARRGEASVDLVHILNPNSKTEDLSQSQNFSARPDIDEPTAYPALEDDAPAAERWLASLSRDLTHRERLRVRTLVGVPGDEILGVARRDDADLIIVGRRGRGRALAAVLGSTVSTVLRRAPCPVFVIVDRPDAIFDDWGEGGDR
jgi:nucleotide-binding universal stress UspA family protein